MLTSSMPVIPRAIFACLLSAACFVVPGLASVSSIGFARGDSLIDSAAAQPAYLSPARLAMAPGSVPEGASAAAEITATLDSDGNEWVWPSSESSLPSQPRVWPWGEVTVPLEQLAIRDQEAESAGLAARLAAEPEQVVSYRATQNRIQAALLAFDAASNAGPEAVVVFAESASEEIRAIIATEVAEAEAELSNVSGSLADSQSPAAPLFNRVGINGVYCGYETIQAAIDAAPNGGTVRLAGGGIFTENINITRAVAVEGGYDASCSAPVPGSANEVRSVALSGSTVDVSGGSIVSLRNLTITLGTDFGAGVHVFGSSQVTLSNTKVTNNAGSVGGGLYVGVGSQMTLTNGSLVSNNTASTSGGGAMVFGRLNVMDTYSDFTGNTAALDGGGVYVSGGTLYVNGADMGGNAALGAASRGGAILADSAVVTFTSNSWIGLSSPCCNVAYDGAGIYANNSRIYSLDSYSTIYRNQAANNGGGIYLTNGSLFGAPSSVNMDSNTAILGAGIYAANSTVEFAGRIVNNVASNSGGGLYAGGSLVTLTGATVGGTLANQPNKIGPAGLNGAGLYLDAGSRATLNTTVVSSNTLQNSGTGYGAGLYLRAGSAVTLTNSTVERNLAPSAIDGRGAGVYVYNSQITIDHSQLISNTAAELGGGIRLFGASVLSVGNGSTFAYNKANAGEGGAIAATNTPDIDIRDSTLRYNSAATEGGAVYVDGGTLDFAGWWDVSFNHTDGSGGAIAVRGTADADFVVTGGGQASYLAGNKAPSNGGALLLGNADTLTLHATSGWPLNLTTNGAGNGGALYADSGGLLDVYGFVNVTDNQATGNGGAFYLSGGSRIWLDDYYTTRPQVLVNLAQNGGAIYAAGSPRVECDGVDFGAVNDGNEAVSGSGGAVYLSGSTMTADNCVFRHNSAADNGGAIAAFTSTVILDADYPVPVALAVAGPGDRLSPAGLSPQATLCQPGSGQCSSLRDNMAGTVITLTGSGGAIYSSDSRLTVNQTYLHRNQAARGGAIYQAGAASRGYITNTLVYSNTSTQPFGAGIRAAAGAISITQGTLANNVGGAGLSPGAASTNVYNTIIWGNSVASYGALAAVSCNIDQGGTAGPASNPLFVSAGAGEDYRVLSTSPAMDACASGLGVDIGNRARPLGTLYDMGAYEVLIRQVFLPVVTRQ